MADPILVASWNAGPATARAAALALQGLPLLDAIVRGIEIVEDDPDEMSVGFGGLPNEDGVVELDAAVMDGTLARAGAVAGLRGVRHPCAVAHDVLRHTDHALLVGEGALKFARQLGYPEENLLTNQARDAWLLWKTGLSTRDAWVGPDDAQAGDWGGARWAGHADNPTPGRPPDEVHPHAPGGGTAGGQTPAPGQSGGAPKVPFTFGTIHVSGLTQRGGTPHIASATSTSGLSYKIPGRAGDSPIVGAGLFSDSLVGSAGCTGRGEATLQNSAAYAVVDEMSRGLSPTDAALAVLRKIASRTRERRLLDAHSRPKFNVTIYALRADGRTGAASMHEGYTYIEQRGTTTTLLPCAFVYAKE